MRSSHIIRRKKPGSLQKFLICATKRELRKNRSEPERSQKYKEVNNNIKRCMKKAKENWNGVVRLKKI